MSIKTNGGITMPNLNCGSHAQVVNAQAINTGSHAQSTDSKPMPADHTEEE
ncbi:MAG TPA: hypothetical protein VJH22_00375 [Candidatus Nanoarchaeia archaeon]|nr:hypothetical protein [Candidatus Nanoarchaeia archaeon]